jgi:hypothetical protein
MSAEESSSAWTRPTPKWSRALPDTGELPVLAPFRAQGMHAPVASIDGLGDDAAWSSFATVFGR